MKKDTKHRIRMFACGLLAAAVTLTGIPVPATRSTVTVAEAASPVVERAISWAVSIANDNSHGYSQKSRWGPDYDCSSFVISAFKNAGVNVGTATYTDNMRSQFTQHGFQWIPWSQIGGVSKLQRGDILLKEYTKAHTEIYLGNNQNVGAHSDKGYPQTGDQTGTEVSVSGYYYHPWDGVLRYAGSEVCKCSTDYAGDYYVTTSSLPLTMRSGHGTGYPAVASIPKDSRVYVSRADGSWAHVEWNGYSGYCSMSYLTKITSRNYRLHVWVSETGMGDVPSGYICDKRYYICYELIDTATGKRANASGNINYKATETIRNSEGKIFEHTYQNSDNNWISAVCDSEDTYTGTVTISGDIGVSASVSFDVYANTAPQIKVWAWENDASREISTIDVGKTAYCSYLVRDKYSGKNLNDATSFWTKGNGYAVTVKVYDPNGSLIKTQSYNNNDCTWFSFQPDKLGTYKIKASVSGNLSGGCEWTVKAGEKEHQYSAWKITKAASCSQTGTKTRVCTLCNKTQTETIPKIDHTIVRDKMVAATCTKEGKTEGEHCSVCGEVIVRQKVIPATGHNFDSDWKADADCHWRECACGEKSIKVFHVFKWVTDRPATSVQTGLKHEECKICGFGRNYNTIINKIESESQVSPSPSDDNAVPPTEEPGLTGEPEDILPPIDEATDMLSPTDEPTNILAPADEATDALSPTDEPTDTLPPGDVPGSTGEPEDILPPADGSADMPALTDEPSDGTSDILAPTDESSDETEAKDDPVAVPDPTNEPADTPVSTGKPASTPAVVPKVPSKPVDKLPVDSQKYLDKPGKVKIKSMTSKKKGQLYLKWKKVKGGSGYQIQYLLKNSFSVKKTANTKKCSAVLRGLKSKKKYYIRIRTYSSQGKNRCYGKWSKVRLIRIK